MQAQLSSTELISETLSVFSFFFLSFQCNWPQRACVPSGYVLSTALCSDSHLLKPACSWQHRGQPRSGECCRLDGRCPWGCAWGRHYVSPFPPSRTHPRPQNAPTHFTSYLTLPRVAPVVELAGSSPTFPPETFPVLQKGLLQPLLKELPSSPTFVLRGNSSKQLLLPKKRSLSKL